MKSMIEEIREIVKDDSDDVVAAHMWHCIFCYETLESHNYFPCANCILFSRDRVPDGFKFANLCLYLTDKYGDESILKPDNLYLVQLAKCFARVLEERKETNEKKHD